VFPYGEKRRYTPPAAPVEHYLAMAKVLGLERGVVVQPSVHGNDTRVTLNAIEFSDHRLLGIIRADRNLTGEEVKRLHSKGIRGLRMALRHKHGNAFDEQLFHQMVKLISPMRWPLDLQIDDDAIAPMEALIRSVPVPVIIDTMGHIDFRKGGLEQSAFQAMLRLLETGNVWVKLHGANRFLSWGVRYEDIVTTARAYIAKAPDRMIWGTDWPHSEIYEPGRMPNDGELLDMLLDFAPDEAVRAKILAHNPSALFEFD
jgi:predicted TIM-barrel fold metal-dependent hydrolase